MYKNIQYEIKCEYVNMKLYNLHTIMNTYIYEFIHAHTTCIEVYELITKLYLHSKQFNTHTHTHIYIMN